MDRNIAWENRLILIEKALMFLRNRIYKIFKLSELWVPWGVAGYESQYEFNSTTCLWEVPVIRSDLKSISKSKQH